MSEIGTTAARMTPELEETRRDLHRNPELSGQEERTSAFVAGKLRSLGLEVRERVGGYGVIGVLKGARQGRTLALRADMDALPIQEENEVPYRSLNPGVMHACGHDGHTTMLLGAARLLSGRREALHGEVRFLFQPAEETVEGASRMCREGAMDGVDAIAALHGWPRVPLGKIGIREGAMMAAADRFDITVRGCGAHAAYPHHAVDPLYVGAQIVTALQAIASREIDPVDPIVVTVAQFHAGTAYNVIPGSAEIKGTARTLRPHTRAEMPDRIRRVAEGICAANRAECEFRWIEGTPPLVNEPGITRLIRRIAADALGEDSIEQVENPSMGAEDFAVYLEYAPGAMFRLGLGDTSPIHTPTFNFADAALPIGVELFSRIALAFLGSDSNAGIDSTVG